MSWIDRRFAGRPSRHQPDTALARYHAARREANLALVDWLRTDPDPEDVALEVDGAIAVIRQLVLLTRGGAS